MKKTSLKNLAKKVWKYYWESNSIGSWILNIVVAFIVIKFVIYPFLTLLTGSALPIVAVVSGSMEHKMLGNCEQYLPDGQCMQRSDTVYSLCGKRFAQKEQVDFDYFWTECGGWYDSKNITKDQFQTFPFVNGFSIGDVMIIKKKPIEQFSIGDVVVFSAPDNTPIIHRIVEISQLNGETVFQTKGDNNADSAVAGPRAEADILYDQYIGHAVFKIPLLGYVKIYAVRLLLMGQQLIQ